MQRIDTISPETEKRYLHHYNFPPYSTGENKPMRGPSRRDIGHGNLAGRALIPVLPSAEEFPYVIRLVSEVVSGNGSTSMASTCGSTLALMDAGVPIKAPVAGAAMGLVIDEATGKFAVLTDILGKEGLVRRHGLQGHRAPSRASRPSRWTSRSRGSTSGSSARG